MTKGIQPWEFMLKKEGKNPGQQEKIPGDSIGTTAASPAGPVLSLEAI